MGGANDRRQKESASYTISNIAAIAQIFTAVGINFNIQTTFYATDNFYLTSNTTLFTVGEVAQCKADVLKVNTAQRAMAPKKVRVIEVFDIMADNMGNAMAAHLQADELHENATASSKIIQRIYDVLTLLYGVRNFTLSPNNRLTNTNFAAPSARLARPVRLVSWPPATPRRVRLLRARQPAGRFSKRSEVRAWLSPFLRLDRPATIPGLSTGTHLWSMLARQSITTLSLRSPSSVSARVSGRLLARKWPPTSLRAWL